MKRLLNAAIMVLLMCIGALCTTVTSTTKIVGPDGQPFTGTIILQLPFAGVNSQTNQLVLATPVTASIVNGIITQPFAVTGNDSMSPAMPYSALYVDAFGTPVTRQLYYITGTTFDVGSAPATPNFLNTNVLFGTTLTITGTATIERLLKSCDASLYNGLDDGAKIISAFADSSCVTVDGSNLTALTTVATIVIPNNKGLILPCGILIGGPLANPVIDINNNNIVRGKSRNCTVVSTQSATADIIAFHNAANWSFLSDLSVRSEVARTAGAGIRVSAGHNVIDRVFVYPVFDGITFDTAIASGNNTVKDSELSDGTGGSPGPGLGGTWHCGVKVGGVPSSTVSGNTFHHVTISMRTAFTDAGYCVQDGSDTTVIEGGSQAVANLPGGVDSVALHIEVVNGGNQPTLTTVTGSIFEGGPTQNSVVISSGFNTTLSSNTFQSGLRGVLIIGGSSIRVDDNQFHANQLEGIKVTSNSTVTIAHNDFSESSQQANNTSSDVFFAAGTVSFVVSGNKHKDFAATGSTCKFAVEIAAGGSDFYSVKDEINNGNCVSGTISDGGTGTNKQVCNPGGPCSNGPTIGFAGDLSASRSTSSGIIFFGANTHHLNFGITNTGSWTFVGGNVIGTFAFASGTASMTTALIAAGACGTTVTVAATGVTTADVVNVTRNAAATSANGGNLNLNAWPTAGNVNFNYCNQSAAGVTPGAMIVNWNVSR